GRDDARRLRGATEGGGCARPAGNQPCVAEPRPRAVPHRLRADRRPVSARQIELAPGTIGPDHVAPDALVGVKRQQTNAARWPGGSWREFGAALAAPGGEVIEEP